MLDEFFLFLAIQTHFSKFPGFPQMINYLWEAIPFCTCFCIIISHIPLSYLN